MLQFPRKEEGKRRKAGKEEKEKEGEEKEREKEGKEKKKQGEEGKGIVLGSIVRGEIRIQDRSVLQRNFELSQISSDI